MPVEVVQVTVEIGHRAWYRKKATLEKTHDWILFVRGSDGNDISHFVEKIVYNLHESFNPSRVVRDKPPYELRESGYGEFYPRIDIYFKNKGEKGAPRKVSFEYFLNLNREDTPPISNLRAEKIKFYHPSDEFMEKLLKAGGVILGSDSHSANSKARLTANDSQAPDSRLQDAPIYDADSGAKFAAHKSKKSKRSSETNPMSNESASSSDSLTSKWSSKSDPFEKASVKRKREGPLIDFSDDDVPKQKKKAVTSEKIDVGKTKAPGGAIPAEGKQPVKVDHGTDKKQKSVRDEGQKHSSSKQHHSRDGSTAREHHEKSTHSHNSSSSSSNKQKSGGNSSRSSSQTPQMTPNNNADKDKDKAKSLSGSRTHSSSSHGGSSGHHRSSSSSSHPHGDTKRSLSKGSRSHHGDQSQSNSRHDSSKHRGSETKSEGLSRKLISSDVQIRLSPMDVQFSNVEMNSRGGGSVRSTGKPDSLGDKLGRSPDTPSSRKSNQPSPMKHQPKTSILPSPLSHSTSNVAGKDAIKASVAADNRNLPKYDKLLDDMKSDDEDEEEDGEIRSPIATDPTDVTTWKNIGVVAKRKDEKPKDTTSANCNKSSKSSSSASRTEKLSSGNKKVSPSKQKGDHLTSFPSEKTSPDTSDEKNEWAQAKSAKKQQAAKENADLGAKYLIPKKPSDSKSHEQKDWSGKKPPDKTLRQKDLSSDEVSSSLAAEVDEKDDHMFDVDALLDDLVDGKMNGIKVKKENDPVRLAYPDRAPNGELLTALVMIKQKLSDMTNCQLLNQIADVIEASGKFKVDEENFEFDLCDLDAETVQKVRELMESE